MSIFDPISVLAQHSEWPIACDRCGDFRSLQISDDFDKQMALLDASYLQSWLEEREYLEKLTELFKRNS